MAAGSILVDNFAPPDVSVEQVHRANRVVETKWLISAALALVAFAVCCRLYHLDTKLFWCDEEITSMLCSSKTSAQFKDYSGKPMIAASWRQLEQVSSSAPTVEVLNNLIRRDHQDQAPIYYLFARAWMQSFGHSSGTLRLLSILFSLLAFPLVFVLARQLFDTDAAWLSVALIACSPFHLLYAQEARPYSMWLCAALVSWIAFVRAHQSGKREHWCASGLVNAIASLTHYSSFIAVAAMAASTFLTRRRPLVLGGALSIVFTGLFISPWIVWGGPGCLNSGHHFWLDSPIDPRCYAFACIEHAAKLFLDVNCQPSVFLKATDSLLFLSAATCSVVGYRQTTEQGRLVMQAAVLYAIAIALFDLVCGGRRLTVMRYMTPVLPLVQICVAACVVAVLRQRPRLGLLVSALLIASGVASCLVIASASTWWSKGAEWPLRVARLLNDNERSMWIGYADVETLEMSRLVHDSVLLERVTPERFSLPPPSIDTVFVFDRKGFVAPRLSAQGWLYNRIDGIDDILKLRRNAGLQPAASARRL